MKLEPGLSQDPKKVRKYIKFYSDMIKQRNQLEGRDTSGAI